MWLNNTGDDRESTARRYQRILRFMCFKQRNAEQFGGRRNLEQQYYYGCNGWFILWHTYGRFWRYSKYYLHLRLRQHCSNCYGFARSGFNLGHSYSLPVGNNITEQYNTGWYLDQQ